MKVGLMGAGRVGLASALVCIDGRLFEWLAGRTRARTESGA